jgi:hypothetical protein
MDVFSRTFLPATSEAGLPIPVVSRHMPMLRRCVTPEETTVLVARCQRVGQPLAGAFLLLLTNRRLVVTKESRLLHRVQLHLASPLRELSHVVWVPEEHAGGLELAATAADGVRERFWLPLRDPLRVRHIDAMLSLTFRQRHGAPAGPRPLPARHHRPVGRLAVA